MEEAVYAFCFGLHGVALFTIGLLFKYVWRLRDQLSRCEEREAAVATQIDDLSSRLLAYEIRDQPPHRTV